MKMKTDPDKQICLSIICLLMMALLVGCASSTGGKAEQTPQTPGASGAANGKEPASTPPKVTGPAVTSPGTTKPKPVPQNATFVHTVKWRGESVSIIAGWYTGDIQNWKILKDYNPDVNPSRIFEGNKSRIPEYLMKTKAPMTKEYVDSFYAKHPKKEAGRPAPPPPAASASDGDEPALFGPK